MPVDKSAGMWKSLFIALASFVIIRDVSQRIRKNGDMKGVLDELRTRWSYFDFEDALEEAAQIYALQLNPEELQYVREQDVERDFDKLKKDHDYLAQQVAAVEAGGFEAEKVFAERKFRIEPEMTEKYLNAWLIEQKARLELTQKKMDA
jgi:hypothetical protein